ncbi:MAG: histone deacetylase family protein [Geminicoccaceae bacterium]
MTLLFYTHPSGIAHEPGVGHPEGPIRLQTVLRHVEEANIPGLVRREAPEATLDQIRRVHPEPYPTRVLESIPTEGFRRLDSDTVVCPASGEAALRAAGAACAAVDAVMAGEAKAAFCAMRPPGHHAEAMEAMGFCLFNNVAVGAMQARWQHKLGRLVIFDFDVHHGNGTQDTFFDDPDTLYISTHQSPLYPGTGLVSERGIKGNILNRPLPPGTAGPAWRRIVARDVLTAIDNWRPQMIFISAGFDAHAHDPLANLALDESDFAWVTTELVALARKHAEGRIVSVMEGGYDPEALGRSVVAHLRVLAEDAPE